MAQPAKDEYHIGLICALRVEMAATAMLDRDYSIIKGESRDQNTYHAGTIHDHNVVIAGLPAGTDGLGAAANTAKDMIKTFHYFDFILLVGIGGGIPHLEKDIDIRLGDVVVSQPSGTSGSVVQYDKGKAKHGRAFRTQGRSRCAPKCPFDCNHFATSATPCKSKSTNAGIPRRHDPSVSDVWPPRRAERSPLRKQMSSP
ncbi:uncharacterized protein Z519_04200 [Cladophialophora bantiana CBS 173.52]|uniref:Nucleoside phosphorylase domain-containing protein n=1 Tax=Cladophialophora bantiana (strain ATCC 10958 / CBS 173.52 / CDC B-1940 / NIH 8579) TaxID=1442370 RepID=A0A0D2HXF5_CLAB1|nr:uncharacterized protein Z519_04200 [Cladophialophora bantiana CBS 173.52]KIW95615.1 hypothetical protein Z519_04200 [Cladophialophora bantiana CBS 173.52]